MPVEFIKDPDKHLLLQFFIWKGKLTIHQGSIQIAFTSIAQHFVGNFTCRLLSAKDK